MCNKKEDENNNDALLFDKVKECMLKMCEEHSDIIEYQLFKEKLKNAKSFSDLSKIL